MNREVFARTRGEVDAVRVVLNEAVRAKSKKELLKRLDHIQDLAREKDFEKINRLLQLATSKLTLSRTFTSGGYPDW